MNAIDALTNFMNAWKDSDWWGCLKAPRRPGEVKKITIVTC